MYFRIVGNHGQERFVRAKSNAEGDIIEDRLKHVMALGKIKRYHRLRFESVTPDEIYNGEEGA